MTEAITLDEIDETAASVFEGYVVRKDLAQQFKGAYPVPTYVGEFLIGRYCATTDPEEIEEGLQVVRRLLADRTVRAGEEELFKSRARERMTVKLIDLVKARLDAKSNAYLAELPSLCSARCEDRRRRRQGQRTHAHWRLLRRSRPLLRRRDR